MNSSRLPVGQISTRIVKVDRPSANPRDGKTVGDLQTFPGLVNQTDYHEALANGQFNRLFRQHGHLARVWTGYFGPKYRGSSSLTNL
jgi:hypothetical protein